MPAQKRALLIGIDNYPDPRNNLNSCVADTLAFRQVLMSAYGFDPADIRLLHNQNATLANARIALDAMFAGASAGDQVVFYESSHGYRYPKGDTMVEVLCLYDQFLEDNELVSRTQVLPPDVFTGVYDACHSGGLNKLFFPPMPSQPGAGTMIGAAVARAKVFQPSSDRAAEDVGSLAQVTKFKFFGRATTNDTGAVVKQYRPLDMKDLPPLKDIGQGALELNGALLAACRADQTAAAGSLATQNLSAFTFALIDQLNQGGATASLSELTDRVGRRLTDLNMSQTPVYEVPAAHQELAQESFISMQPTGRVIPGGDGIGAAIQAWLRQLQASVNP